MQTFEVKINDWLSPARQSERRPAANAAGNDNAGGNGL
jgi:hypothetical protein